MLPALLWLAGAGIALSLIDLDTRRLPDAVVGPSVHRGAGAAGPGQRAHETPGARSAGRDRCGRVVRSVPADPAAWPGGMGGGDVKLAALLGLVTAWLGWDALVVGHVRRVRTRRRASASRCSQLGGLADVSALPFGPFLVVGAFVGVLAGAPLAGAYLDLLAGGSLDHVRPRDGPYPPDAPRSTGRLVNPRGALVPYRRLIGLDIGSGSVRAAEITMDGADLAFHNFGQVALPGGAVAGGMVLDPGAVTLAIGRLWKERRFTGREVVMGVANQQVVVRVLDLPWVEPAVRKQTLPYLVRDVLPLPVEQAVLDFLPLEPDPVPGEPIHGLLVASPRESIATMVRCAEQAGLRPTAVDLASFALLRSVGSRGPGRDHRGARRHRRDRDEHRDPRGRGAAGRPDRAAGRRRRDRRALGPVDDLERGGRGPEAARGPVRRATARPRRSSGLAMTPLLEEIRSSLDYFTATHGGARVDRLRLCGGGSLLPGLREAVAERLRLKVDPADPMWNMPIKGKNLDLDQVELFRPLSAVPIGLALGAA